MLYLLEAVPEARGLKAHGVLADVEKWSNMNARKAREEVFTEEEKRKGRPVYGRPSSFRRWKRLRAPAAIA
jgi:hypothetical protein